MNTKQLSQCKNAMLLFLDPEEGGGRCVHRAHHLHTAPLNESLFKPNTRLRYTAPNPAISMLRLYSTEERSTTGATYCKWLVAPLCREK